MYTAFRLSPDRVTVGFDLPPCLQMLLILIMCSPMDGSASAPISLVSDDSCDDSSASSVSEQPRRSSFSSGSRVVPRVAVSESSVDPVESVPYLQYCVARGSGALLGRVVRYYPASLRLRSALTNDVCGQLRLRPQYDGPVPRELASLLRST